MLKIETKLDLSTEQKNLRSKNVTTLITINNEAYMPPGWGTSGTGTSVNARLNFGGYIRYLNGLEKNLILQLNEQKEDFERVFDIEIERMDLSLFQIDPIKIFDRENNLLITINSFDGNNLSIKIRKYSSTS